MYADWMENTPIFGKIKDVYIGNIKEEKKMTVDELRIKNKIENIQNELNLLLSENCLKINIEVEECTNTYDNWDYVRLKVYREL